MTRRRVVSTEYQHPTTYAAFVHEQQLAHNRRLAELKAASKTIVAIEPDLYALAAQRIYYRYDDYTMRLASWLPSTGPIDKKALRLGFNGEDVADRAISALIARHWIVDETKLDGRFSKVLLRKPKTRVRVMVDYCSEAYAKALTPQPEAEAAQ